MPSNVLEFDVTYRLGEYLKFALEHVRHTAKKQPGAVGVFLISAFAIPVFLLKSRKLGKCAFAIDAEGILRHSRGGEMNIRWHDVTAVRRYSPGLVIEKLRGAVPIPYRCLDAEQQSSLDALVAQWKRGRDSERKS